ncbi:hypothetical protein QQF64_013055 [Cirrhinus molitorella]|uniref:Uncharacterized protein n=1 Tax=Cirrhinus molitorella TaxID=172907 RepID=A0ABR3LTB9_9TELE
MVRGSWSIRQAATVSFFPRSILLYSKVTESTARAATDARGEKETENRSKGQLGTQWTCQRPGEKETERTKPRMEVEHSLPGVAFSRSSGAVNGWAPVEMEGLSIRFLTAQVMKDSQHPCNEGCSLKFRVKPDPPGCVTREPFLSQGSVRFALGPAKADRNAAEG